MEVYEHFLRFQASVVSSVWFPFMGIAHVVERPTEEPGAILTWVRVPGAAMDFSPTVSFQCRLSYGVRVQSRASTSVRTLNIPNTGNHIIVWTHADSSHIF